MKMCKPHWDKLRTAVQDKGMEHLVSKNQDECVQRYKRIMQSPKIDPKDYDPLFDSHMQIMTHAIQAAPYLATPEAEKLCPLCELDRAKEKGDIEEGSEDWIKYSTNSALEFCRLNNLVFTQ